MNSLIVLSLRRVTKDDLGKVFESVDDIAEDQSSVVLAADGTLLAGRQDRHPSMWPSCLP